MILSGNKIVVTGGGSGIGKGLSDAFAARGNEVIVAGQARFRDRDVGATPDLGHLILDQDDPVSIAAFARALLSAHPATNVLINNAGIQRTEDLAQGAVEPAVETVMVDLLGPIRVTAALLPHFLAQPHATIINVTSALAFVPLAATPTYSACKAALHAYTLALRYQLRDTNVQVIEIVPPIVQTGLQGDQGCNPGAMPLPEFVSEVMQLLTDDPQAAEVVVERARRLRFAPPRDFDAVFQQYNEASSRG